MRNQLTKLKAKIKNQKGFTLIELMAVIAILAMIVLIAVPAVGGILEKAKAGSEDAHISMIEHAAGLAHVGASVNPAPGELPKKNSYTAEELVEGGYLNAELTPEDKLITVTKQPNGTFSGGGTGGSQPDDAFIEEALKPLIDGALAAEANNEELWSFTDTQFYPVGLLFNNSYLAPSFGSVLNDYMDVFLSHPNYDVEAGMDGNALVMVKTGNSYQVDWLPSEHVIDPQSSKQ